MKQHIQDVGMTMYNPTVYVSYVMTYVSANPTIKTI